MTLDLLFESVNGNIIIRMRIDRDGNYSGIPNGSNR